MNSPTQSAAQNQATPSTHTIREGLADYLAKCGLGEDPIAVFLMESVELAVAIARETERLLAQSPADTIERGLRQLQYRVRAQERLRRTLKDLTTYCHKHSPVLSRPRNQRNPRQPEPATGAHAPQPPANAPAPSEPARPAAPAQTPVLPSAVPDARAVHSAPHPTPDLPRRPAPHPAPLARARPAVPVPGAP